MRVVLLALLLGGCAATTDLLQSPLTRTERDTYTLLERDTLVRTQLRNPPGEADHGVLFPSLRQTEVRHTTVLRDSIVERHYPNFIRIGLFESVGLLGTASSDRAYDAGLFGLFPDFPQQDRPPQGTPLFTGAWRRLGIVEYRFPWFYGARGWSVGTAAVELFQLSRDEAEWLAGILPLFVRKRWYWREEPPYVAGAAGLGVSLLPSQYLHLSASLEVGSLGGVNVRGYVGFLWGQNPAGAGFVQTASGRSIAKLFAGLGTSLADFLNHEEELQQEWRQQRHSAWSIGLGHFLFLRTSSSRSIWTEGGSPLITGMLARMLPVQLALPVGPPGVYVGTSLMTLLLVGTDGGALGILPLRLGYWHELVPAGLYSDLGAEALYYPSHAVALSARLLLRLSDFFTLCAVAGFANGSPGRGNQWWDLLQEATSFQSWYIGIGVGLGEHLFRKQDLWYYRH